LTAVVADFACTLAWLESTKVLHVAQEKLYRQRRVTFVERIKDFQHPESFCIGLPAMQNMFCLWVCIGFI
jgi:hypothetical protein